MKAVLMVVVAAQVVSGPEPIPVDQEPRHHIVYSNARLRVLEVAIPARDTTLEHVHTHDLVTVNIANGPTRTRDRGAEWGAVRPRSVGGINVNEYTGKPVAHVVQTVGDGPYRLTGVENLKDGGWSTLPPVGGQYLAVATESRAFRTYEMRLPASTAVTHTHAVPVVITLVEGAVSTGAGDPALTVSGQWRVVAPSTAHEVASLGTGAHVVEVEVR